jgi:hypothetical protein
VIDGIDKAFACWMTLAIGAAFAVRIGSAAMFYAACVAAIAIAWAPGPKEPK